MYPTKFYNFVMFFFPYHPKSNVAASPHKSKKNCKYQCQLKGIQCHLRPWVMMGFSYIWLDLLPGYVQLVGRVVQV